MIKVIARYMFLPLLLLIALPGLALGCSGDQSNSGDSMTGPATIGSGSTFASTDADTTSFDGTFTTADGTTGTIAYTYRDPGVPVVVTGDASFVYTPDTNIFFTITTTTDGTELPVGTTYDIDLTWSSSTAGSYASTRTEPSVSPTTSSGSFTYNP